MLGLLFQQDKCTKSKQTLSINKYQTSKQECLQCISKHAHNFASKCLNQTSTDFNIFLYKILSKLCI